VRTWGNNEQNCLWLTCAFDDLCADCLSALDRAMLSSCRHFIASPPRQLLLRYLNAKALPPVKIKIAALHLPCQELSPKFAACIVYTEACAGCEPQCLWTCTSAQPSYAEPKLQLCTTPSVISHRISGQIPHHRRRPQPSRMGSTQSSTNVTVRCRYTRGTP